LPAWFFAALAGRELVPFKKPVDFIALRNRMMDLLAKEDLTPAEEEELSSISSQFEEEVLLSEERKDSRAGTMSISNIYEKEVSAEELKGELDKFIGSLISKKKRNRVIAALSKEFSQAESRGWTVSDILISKEEYALIRNFGKDSPFIFSKKTSDIKAGKVAVLWNAPIRVIDDFDGVVCITPDNYEDYSKWLD
jgi:hypothetical protein